MAGRRRQMGLVESDEYWEGEPGGHRISYQQTKPIST